ncbi:MAG: hypothetical protein H7839_12320 [Magnetococcus sp. YQC-5]
MPTSPSDWIDRVSWPLLLLLAAWLAVAPVHPEPHLLEKWRMLFHGTLARPIDIFDFVLHTAPLVIVGVKLRRLLKQRSLI